MKQKIRENLKNNNFEIKKLGIRINRNKDYLKKTTESLNRLRKQEVPEKIKKTKNDLQLELESTEYLNSLFRQTEAILNTQKTKNVTEKLKTKIQRLNTRTRVSLQKMEKHANKDNEETRQKIDELENAIRDVQEGGEQNLETLNDVIGKLDQVQGREKNEREVLEGNLSQMENDFRKLEDKIDENFEKCEKKLRGIKRHVNSVDAAVYQQQLVSSAEAYFSSGMATKRYAYFFYII